MGMYAESAHLCAMIQDDNRLCLQALRQAMESQNPEVVIPSGMSLTVQIQGASGESSMEGSIAMEHTPPQMFTGVSPASLKVICHPVILLRLLIPSSGNPAVEGLKIIVSHPGLHHLLFNGNSRP